MFNLFQRSKLVLMPLEGVDIIREKYTNNSCSINVDEFQKHYGVKEISEDNIISIIPFK